MTAFLFIAAALAGLFAFFADSDVARIQGAIYLVGAVISSRIERLRGYE